MICVANSGRSAHVRARNVVPLVHPIIDRRRPRFPFEPIHQIHAARPERLRLLEERRQLAKVANRLQREGDEREIEHAEPALTVEGMYQPGVFRTQAGELANGVLAPSPRVVGSQMWGSSARCNGSGGWRRCPRRAPGTCPKAATAFPARMPLRNARLDCQLFMDHEPPGPRRQTRPISPPAGLRPHLQQASRANSVDPPKKRVTRVASISQKCGIGLDFCLRLWFPVGRIAGWRRVLRPVHQVGPISARCASRIANDYAARSHIDFRLSLIAKRRASRLVPRT